MTCCCNMVCLAGIEGPQGLRGYRGYRGCCLLFTVYRGAGKKNCRFLRPPACLQTGLFVLQPFDFNSLLLCHGMSLVTVVP